MVKKPVPPTSNKPYGLTSDYQNFKGILINPKLINKPQPAIQRKSKNKTHQPEQSVDDHSTESRALLKYQQYDFFRFSLCNRLIAKSVIKMHEIFTHLKCSPKKLNWNGFRPQGTRS